MSLPNSYLMTPGKVEAYFDAIQNAEAPERFSHKFIENLGFTSSNDRLLIGVLKDLGFLDTDGAPQQRYYEYLDRTRSQKVLAEGVREAYDDLFAVNIHADEMDVSDVKNKLRTLYAGSKTDNIVSRVAKTFEALCSVSDFTKATSPKPVPPEAPTKKETKQTIQTPTPPVRPDSPGNPIGVRALQYHINLILPESRDQAVYDAIFRAMREHLG